MDDARAVLSRLERIEGLDSRGAPAPVLLAELRQLVAEAEVWVRVEPGQTDRAEGAIGRLREAVDDASSAPRSTSRTLLA